MHSHSCTAVENQHKDSKKNPNHMTFGHVCALNVKESPFDVPCCPSSAVLSAVKGLSTTWRDACADACVRGCRTMVHQISSTKTEDFHFRHQEHPTCYGTLLAAVRAAEVSGTASVPSPGALVRERGRPWPSGRA